MSYLPYLLKIRINKKKHDGFLYKYFFLTLKIQATGIYTATPKVPIPGQGIFQLRKSIVSTSLLQHFIFSAIVFFGGEGQSETQNGRPTGIGSLG